MRNLSFSAALAGAVAIAALFATVPAQAQADYTPGARAHGQYIPDTNKVPYFYSEEHGRNRHCTIDVWGNTLNCGG